MTDRRNIDPQEWELRCDLAAAYRLFARFGMDDLIFTHLSVRLPGKDHRFLLNPFGHLFDEITASSLIAVDPEGHAIEKLEEAKINNAGFTIHSAVHMARDDAQCVMHSHTTAGMAVAAQEQGLLPLNQMSMQFFGRTSYHDYEGIALDLDERDRLVRPKNCIDIWFSGSRPCSCAATAMPAVVWLCMTHCASSRAMCTAEWMVKPALLILASSSFSMAWPSGSTAIRLDAVINNAGFTIHSGMAWRGIAQAQREGT